MEDPRLDAAPFVRDFAAAVAPLVSGLYVGGSLATGDYRPGVSDVDAVALVERAPAPARRRVLVAVHEHVGRVDGGAALHCVYVPLDDATDGSRRHWTWAFGELFRRPLSGIARAELLADPIRLQGPAPSSWLPPMGPDELRAAARAELTGYWSAAVRKRAIWTQDVYVDVGLTVLARADLTIREGRLVPKSAAIDRLDGLGVPPEVVDGVRARRDGQSVELTDAARAERAVLVRRLMADGIARLTRPR